LSFAVEMYLDAEVAGRVHQTWLDLAGRGISSEMLDIGSCPHITLAAFDEVDPERLRSIIESLSNTIGDLEIELASIGRFPTAEGVIFVAPVVTMRLLELHARFHQELSGLGISSWDYYRPGHWVPHCTIALGVDRSRVDEVMEIAERHGVFRQAQISGLSLVAFRPVREVYTYPVRLKRGQDDDGS